MHLMNRTARNLLSILASILVVGVASAGLSLVVQYKPYGVPDHQRDEYEQTVAKIQRNKIEAQRLADLPRPKALISDRRHEFGMLDPHVTASHEFKISNDGDAPLILNVAETSCKCTLGKVDKGQLMPGESTSVTLTWNTGYQADHYEQQALIDTNDPALPTIKLSVSGTVKAQMVAPERVGMSIANPGEPSEGHFYVYSQLWDDFIVEDIRSDLSGFLWSAEPVDPTVHSELALEHAVAAWKVSFSSVAAEPGGFESTLHVTTRCTDTLETLERGIEVRGRVHKVISFHGPELHMHTGLDLGTLVIGKEHLFHVLVRQRSDRSRPLEVMDVEPKILKVDLRPTSREGDYRMTIRVPADSAPATFNLDSQQGYVQVGDPETPGLSNWLPLQGTVIQLDR